MGKTASAIKYCRKVGESNIASMNISFGFGSTIEHYVVGNLSINTPVVCQRVVLARGDCFVKVGADGTTTLQRLQLTTKTGKSVWAGFDFGNMKSWGIFEEPGCMTGLHGAAHSGQIYAVGFYFND